MSSATLFFRESSLSKVAAVFDSGMQARAAVAQLLRLPHFKRGQVQMIGPFDEDWGRKVEPEEVGTWRTAIQSHLSCGVIGFAVGALTFIGLLWSDATAVTASPLPGFMVLAAFGTMLGLMAGGLLTMRPDHDAVIQPVREAKDHGRWSVVVHPSSNSQLDDALRTLAATGADVSRTL